ncbi:MAG: histidinol-phosphate transaminase [Pseudomonadota bacterium]
MTEVPTRPVPQPGLLGIAPYTAGKGSGGGANIVTKLSANENPLGPSPATIDAVKTAADTLALYPDQHHGGLREAIAEVHGLEADRIVCGAGSDELIALLCQAYCGPGMQVVHNEHGFAMYPISARAAGAEPVAAPEQDRTADVDAMLGSVEETTAMVFLANPNNPTGTMLPEVDVLRLAQGLPEHVLLVLDGAYAEYIEGFDGHARLVDRFANVVMTRTFSKIYGLGGLRVGWCYAPPEIVNVLQRVRGPFNVSAAGLAGAEAAVRDQEWVARCRAENTFWRAWMTTELRALGLKVDQSQANFILPRFGDAFQAAAAEQRLSNQGIIVRPVGSYGLSECLRISIGDEVACRRVIAVLQAFLEEAA